MPSTRRIQGELCFPDDAPVQVAERVVVELRDVSRMDQPSLLLARFERQGLPVGPSARVPFDFVAPEAHPANALGLRAQVDLHGGGGYLSTAAAPVPPSGDATTLRVPVTRT